MATRTLLVGNEISSVVEEAASSQPSPQDASSPQPHKASLSKEEKPSSTQLPSSSVDEATASQPPSSVDEASSSKPPQEASPSPCVGIEISPSVASNRQTILHRVPHHVRENKMHIYDPMVLSIGPYHHGRSSGFQETEQLKEKIVDLTLNSNDKDLFRRKILERIDEVRYFCGGISTHEFDDDALAQMMLRDACCVLHIIKFDVKEVDLLVLRLGRTTVVSMLRDFLMLENQIPFWIIKLLIDLAIEDGDTLLCTFLSDSNFADYRLTEVPWKEGEEPLHLIEAHRITLVKEEIGADSRSQNIDRQNNYSRRVAFKIQSSPRHSVTELKTKGIHFSPSSNCLKDIRELCLPILHVTSNSKVFFSNTIAFEMSSESNTDYAVASYITFMKTLIENTEDVSELKKKGILFSTLANDNELVQMFKEIDGLDDYGSTALLDVQMKINKHCSIKTNTWMTELIYKYFRSPWTVIALFVATFLVVLTILQTYYTMRPPK
ncbi:PREDICTED: UPF0481 protein At3g47200-like [Erythranthe guttata]|nr:PREDICTED: UPF0481 protein At3g47200-like [Erythranthe guttata]|eukprot:XP_012847054.1 PREDICTED: UPF0481 protein At3g47200-like [Erythranthe guttata]